MTVSAGQAKLAEVTIDSFDSPPPQAGPPAPHVTFLTMAVGRRVRLRVDSALAEHGLTYRHLSALGHLAGNPDLSYAELARRSGITTQSMQATLTQLQELGAVEQRNKAKRGLRAQLRVTAAGTLLLERGTTAMNRVEQQLLAALPPEQQRALRPALLALLTTMLGESATSRATEPTAARSEDPERGRSEGAAQTP